MNRYLIFNVVSLQILSSWPILSINSYDLNHNNRIVKVENDRVTFLYRDHSDEKLKPITVDADEFIRRFFLHALPDNFYRIRYYPESRIKRTL